MQDSLFVAVMNGSNHAKVHTRRMIVIGMTGNDGERVRVMDINY